MQVFRAQERKIFIQQKLHHLPALWYFTQCLMLGNFLFRRRTDFKQRVNKKQNVEIDNPASSGGQENYMKYATYTRLPFEAALSILKRVFFFWPKRTNVREGIIKSQRSCHQCRIINFIKISSILKVSVR